MLAVGMHRLLLDSWVKERNYRKRKGVVNYAGKITEQTLSLLYLLLALMFLWTVSSKGLMMLDAISLLLLCFLKIFIDS